MQSKTMISLVILIGTVSGAAAFWADEPGETPEPAGNVYLDVSNEARTRLSMVDAYLREKQWTEAVELLHATLDELPDKVIPVVTGPLTTYQNLRSYCHKRLIDAGPEALKIYRQRVDRQAEELLKTGLAKDDRAVLLRLADELFCSSSADRALEHLGDHAMAQGRFAEAQNWWQRLLPVDFLTPTNDAKGAKLPDDGFLRYPDPKTNTPRILAKWALARRWEGDPADFRLAVAVLRTRHGEASGKLAGKSGRYWEILQSLDGTVFEAPITPSDWPTFAGDPSRSRVAPRAVQFGGLHYEWDFTTASATPTRRLAQRSPAPKSDERPSIMPVVAGSFAYLIENDRLCRFDLESGKEERWDIKIDLRPLPGDTTGPIRQTFTVAGNRLYYCTPGLVHDRATNRFFQQRVVGENELHCLDLSREGAGVWVKRSPNFGERSVLFEGSPLVDGNSVYVAMTRVEALMETSIACFDAETGEQRWRTVLCESGLEGGERYGLPLLLTKSDNRIFCVTNLGAIGAVQADTGRLEWVTTYPRRRGERNAMAPALELNPCVYHQGRVFVAPADDSRILALDAKTGRRLWESFVPTSHLLGVAKGMLFATGDRVWALDIQTGKIRWYWAENPTSGYGRGVLAGDYVYWPTKTDIFVLNQLSGQPEPSIQFMHRFRRTPGNLVVANDQLLVAQRTRLLSIGSYEKALKRNQQELARDPKSAESHLRLAVVARDMGDFDLARKSIEAALAFGKPNQVFDGQVLLRFATQLLIDESTARSNQAVARKEWDQADRLLSEALAKTAEPELRARVWQSRLGVWRTADNTPKVLETLRQMLTDPASASASIPLDPERSVSALVWARQQLVATLSKATPQVRAEVEREAAKALERVDNPAKLIALAEQFTGSASATQMLLQAGEKFRVAREWEAARRAYRAALEFPDTLAPTDRFVALVGMAETLKSMQSPASYRSCLRQIERDFGDRPMPNRPETKAGEWARSQLSLELTGAPAAKLTRVWTQRATASWLVPAGMPAGADQDAFFRVGAGRIARHNLGNDTTAWAMGIREKPSSAWRTEFGLLLCGTTDLRCLDWTTGATRWETNLNEVSDGWKPMTGNMAQGNEAPTVTGVAAKTAHLVATHDICTTLFAGMVVTRDAENGRILWTQPAKGANSLEVSTTCFLLRRSDLLRAIEPRSGRTLVDVTIRESVEGVKAVEAGGKLLVMTDRHLLKAFDLTTGALAWQRELLVPSMCLPTLHYDGRESLVVVVDGWQAHRLNLANGGDVWSQPINDRPDALRPEQQQVTPTGVALARNGQVELLAFDTGKIRWRRPLDGAGTPQLLHVGGILLASFSRDGQKVLAALSPENGALTQIVQFEDLTPNLAEFTATDKGVFVSDGVTFWSLALK